MKPDMIYMPTTKFGTAICIYNKSEKEFIRTNPICKECLVRIMCIQELRSGYGIKIRVCERMYEHLQIVKENDENLIKFK